MVFRPSVLLLSVGYVELGAIGRFLQLIEFFLAGLILDIWSEGLASRRIPTSYGRDRSYNDTFVGVAKITSLKPLRLSSVSADLVP